MNLIMGLILALLLVVNALGVVLVVFQLPGTWVMLLVTTLMFWWQPEYITYWTVAILLALAILGEILEFVTAAHGAKKAGASRRGAVMALIGGVGGAVAGTPVPPIPVGTIAGACLGAALGSYLGDLWAGRSQKEAIESGRGAFRGRFWGTLGKVGVAMAMWLVTAAAVFLT